MAETGTAELISGQDTPSEESLLLDHARRIERNRQGTFAVHIRLSRLRAHYRHSDFIRIAARAFEDLVTNFEAVLYILSQADFVLICRDVPIDDIDAPIYKLRALFSEDPLTVGDEGSLEDRFTAWYDLSQPSDYASFLSLAEDLEALGAPRFRKLEEPRRAVGDPLDPSNLSEINSRLQGVRIADLIRSQSAIEVLPGGKGEVLFREHYISMADLQKRIAPEVNLFANPWLFQYLTETLDRRMLAVMAQRDFSTLDHAISLNLNISTILTPGFQNFNDKIGRMTGKVVIELQIIDIFSDMGAFGYARDWLREHGYRVLIDGLNPLSLQFFDPSLLEADLVKITWSGDFLGGIPDNRMVEMRAVVERTGKDSVVLARVDSEEAVEWGLTLGITRFQGHFIDRVVEAMVAKGII